MLYPERSHKSIPIASILDADANRLIANMLGIGNAIKAVGKNAIVHVAGDNAVDTILSLCGWIAPVYDAFPIEIGQGTVEPSLFKGEDVGDFRESIMALRKKNAGELSSYSAILAPDASGIIHDCLGFLSAYPGRADEEKAELQRLLSPIVIASNALSSRSLSVTRSECLAAANASEQEKYDFYMTYGFGKNLIH